MRFRLRLIVLVSIALGSIGAAARGVVPQGLEYEVKAAFLFNFANFATWPPGTFAAPAAPVRVCVLRPDPFGALLDRTMDGGSVDGHPVVVERIDDSAVPQCLLVFVPRAAAGRAPEVIRAAAAGPILTVGESPQFLAQGGMINFVLDGGRVRFDVNVPAAVARRIGLSSRLLRVARNIERAEGGER